MRPIRRVPATITEYAAALTASQNEGASHALEIVLYVLIDKFGWDHDQLKALMGRVAYQAQAVTEGRVTVKDIEKVLRDEYGIEV